MTFDLIVPVYNTNEVFLKECFDSIFALKNKNFKVTVVNDCSTRKETIDFLDNLKKIYSEYSDKILIINNQVNKKLSGARNVGFENSSNDLV
jgi:glycosyltransferase involved in cell wall biosynthesis